MPGLLDIIGQALSMPTALQQQKQGLLQSQQQTQLGQQNLNYQTAMNQAILDGLRRAQQQGQQAQGVAPQAPPQSPPQGLLPPTQTTQSPTGPVTSTGLLPDQAQAAPGGSLLGMANGAQSMINAAHPTGGLLPPVQGQQSQPQQAQQPSWLTPPSANDISSLPVGGLPASIMPFLAMKAGKSTADAANETRAAQIAAAKQQYDPIVQSLAGIVQSDNPVRDVNANPMLLATWQHYAQARGLDPSQDLNATNVRQVFGGLANQYRSQLGEGGVAPPIPLQNSTDQYGRQIQTDPTTGKQTVLPSPTVEKVVTPDHPEGTTLPVAQAIGRQPYNQFSVNQAQLGPYTGLMGALAQAGVTVPSGRNGQQLVATLQGLKQRNPGLSDDQIADQIRTGQLDFSGAKRSVGQLATTLATTTAQSAQLEKNFDSLQAVAGKVDSTGVPIINKAFAAFRRNITGGSDIAQFTGYFNAVTSEYAKLISGGTGAAAPSEGVMKEARAAVMSAYSQGGLQGLRTALTTEANNKRASYQEGLNSARGSGSQGGTNPPTTGTTSGKSVNWADLK